MVDIENIEMEIAECGFCNQIFKADKEYLVTLRKLAEKQGRKSWKPQDFLKVITNMAGDCPKKEGEDKDHVLRWRKEYIDGNIEIANKARNIEKKLSDEQKKLEEDRELIVKLEKKLEETKEEVKKLIEDVKVDTSEHDNSFVELEQRTGGKEANIWV